MLSKNSLGELRLVSSRTRGMTKVAQAILPFPSSAAF